MSRRTRGVVALALAAPLALGGCSGGAVHVTAPPGLSTADAATCTRFLAALPGSLDDQGTREVSPPDAPARAWGDPAITVTCGVGVPADYAPGGACEVADGVGWFVPQDVYDDPDADVTMTAVGYRPIVQLHIPHHYRPAGPAAVTAALAGAVKDDLRLVERCQ